MNILLVEDHPFQQQVLRNQLERAATDSCVSVASTGKEALAQINITLPDVLVCDLNMPEMDGITFLSHLPSCHSMALSLFPVQLALKSLNLSAKCVKATN